jgi:hypothetical protein
VPEPFRSPPGRLKLDSAGFHDASVAALVKLADAPMGGVDPGLGLPRSRLGSPAEPRDLPANAVVERLFIALLIGEDLVAPFEQIGIRAVDRDQTLGINAIDLNILCPTF